MFTVNIKLQDCVTTAVQQLASRCQQSLGSAYKLNLSENITDAQTLIIMSVGTFQNNLKSFI